MPEYATEDSTPTTTPAARRRLRRVLPVAAAVVVVAGALAVRGTATADELPAVTPEALLGTVAAAEPQAMSGTVVQTSRLGLPELPATGPPGSSPTGSLASFMTGSHTARVWYGGPSQVRLSVVADLAETTLVRDGETLWTYDSTSGEVGRTQLPDNADDRDADASAGAEGAPTPDQMADMALALVDPTTEVGVGPQTSIAGRSAYELVLTPRSDTTLVGAVRIGVDGETGVPLRVQVLAKGQTAPAVEVGFTSVRFEAPDPSVFDFTPPPGATVTEHEIPAGALADTRTRAEGFDRPDGPPPGVEVIGTGWDTVVVAPFDTGDLLGRAAGRGESAGELLEQLTTAVDGGRALNSNLLSALLLDDGRVLVGAVPVSELERIAAS